MIVAMRQLELLGRGADLEKAVLTLQRLRVAEVVPASAEPVVALESVVHALHRTRTLLAVLVELRPNELTKTSVLGVDSEAAGPLLNVVLLEGLEPRVAALTDQAQQLATEQSALQHQVEVLEHLEALVPELAHLTEAELRLLDLSSVALVLDDPDGRVVDALEVRLRDVLGDRHLFVSTGTGERRSGDPSAQVTGCLLVIPHAELPRVEALLGGDRISRLTVPEQYAGRSLHSTVAGMRERLTKVPREVEQTHTELSALLNEHAAELRRLEHQLRALLERDVASGAARSTDRTFALRVWVPADAVEQIADELASALSQAAVVVTVEDRDILGHPPTLLRHRRAWRPFGNLVTFLSWPTPGGIDPTAMMAVALPFLFGVMVGDVVYGVLLVLIGWWLSTRTTQGTLQRDAAHILMIGGGWATLFGVLFGEALGNLGNKLGMPALWFYRGGPEALEPLLLFALALGAVHITLGLLLGLWQAVLHRRRNQIADRAGTLLFLIGLFALAGVVASALPGGLLTPAIAAICIGVVVASVSHGALGLLLGPLELLGTLGNILSYLRVAAVGLASVYLANVANELAATAPLLLGILIAAFFHTLNLALAAFSPTVQALRLHYVEFFSKFYDDSGRPFQPLGADLGPFVSPAPDAGVRAASSTPQPPGHPSPAPGPSRRITTTTALTTGAATERETSWKQA